METKTYSTVSRNEALINELKGGLFEYLTARRIASYQGLEGYFMRNVPLLLRKRFMEYEIWLQQNDLELLKNLPELAQKSVEALTPYLPESDGYVALCGRRNNRTDSLGEADIIITKKPFPPLGIGLKLCKAGAFVNTKSGGIRSFLNKYFIDEFGEKVEKAQMDLNRSLDQSFDRMAGELYESAGLTYLGEWDQEWQRQGLSLLPGELSLERREIVLRHYERVIDTLYGHLQSFWQIDARKVIRSLAPLLGFINKELIQVICFYKKKYKLQEVLTLDGRAIDWNNISVKMGPKIMRRSSFEFLLEDRVLQIRVKPMNRFSARALKVNCSVKWKRDR